MTKAYDDAVAAARDKIAHYRMCEGIPNDTPGSPLYTCRQFDYCECWGFAKCAIMALQAMMANQATPWRIVPSTATAAMARAANERRCQDDVLFYDAIYRAMVAAAPNPLAAFLG